MGKYNSLTKDTTDAYLVRLAVRHGLKLATLDMSRLAKPWASGQTFNPIFEKAGLRLRLLAI
jgi:hypothetical protein